MKMKLQISKINSWHQKAVVGQKRTYKKPNRLKHQFNRSNQGKKEQTMRPLQRQHYAAPNRSNRISKYLMG